MRILVTGGDGQLGRALARRNEVHSIVALGRHDLDVTSNNAPRFLADAAPDAIINAAAFTDVDACEGDPDAAFRINALGARNVAVGAELCGGVLVQVSSDYVFSGSKGAAYWEFDRPDPMSVYGASKLAAERLVTATCRRVFIVRSAWLYSVRGRNFVNRILRLASERAFLEVVDEEVGSPTFCDDLADALLALLETKAYGVHHLVNEGACSRHELARAVLDRAGRQDYDLRVASSFSRPARPPSYAPLRNFAAAEAGIRLPDWQSGLDRFFERRTRELEPALAEA